MYIHLRIYSLLYCIDLKRFHPQLSLLPVFYSEVEWDLPNVERDVYLIPAVLLLKRQVINWFCLDIFTSRVLTQPLDIFWCLKVARVECILEELQTPDISESLLSALLSAIGRLCHTEISTLLSEIRSLVSEILNVQNSSSSLFCIKNFFPLDLSGFIWK